MTVIAVCNQKGGSGKTTLAINLAGAFAADGMGVLLLDMDPQGSALDWGSIQPAFPPSFEVMEIDRPQLLRQARGLRRDYEVIVIDCPAKFADSSSAAIRVADLVLVPVQPSPFDVWASDAIAGLIKTRQEATGGVPAGSLRHIQGHQQHVPAALHRSRPGGLWVAGAAVRHHAKGGLRHDCGPREDRVRGTWHSCPPRDGIDPDEIREMIHGAQSKA